MTALACAYDAVHDVARVVRPPEDTSFQTAAEASVVVSAPGGYTGPLRLDWTPYMIDPCEATLSRRYHTVAFVGPARTGKTWSLLLGAIGVRMVSRPADVLVVQTAQDTARRFSHGDLDRMIRSSPRVRAELAPGGWADNVFDKTFRSGAKLYIGWPSKNQLAGVTVPVVLLTDYDRMPQDAAGDGSVYELARKRTQTFMSRAMTVVESSPSAEPIDPRWHCPAGSHMMPPTAGISAVYNMGTRKRWFWTCLHCGGGFEASMDCLSWLDRGDDLVASSKTAVAICPHCGAAHEPRQKTELNALGQYVGAGQRIEDGEVCGELVDTPIDSYAIEGPAAKFQSWEDLVLKRLQAERAFQETNNERPLKVFWNQDGGRVYVPEAAGVDLDPHALAEREGDFSIGEVPPGVWWLTAHVDVQKHRFVIQVHGWGPTECGSGFERYVIDRWNLRWSRRNTGSKDNEHVDPSSYPEDWDLLIGKVLDRSYRDGNGDEFRPVKMSVDSGGEEGVTEQAYAFWRRCHKKRLGHRVVLVKGAARLDARYRITYPEASGKTKGGRKRAGNRRGLATGDVPLMLVSTNKLKDGIANSLAREERGPGYVHFASGLGLAFYEELCAETRDPSGNWIMPQARRNEAFDLFVYGDAVALDMGIEKLSWKKPPGWARPPGLKSQRRSETSRSGPVTLGTV